MRVTEVRETIKHDTTRYTDKKLVSDEGETIKRDTTWLVVYCYKACLWRRRDYKAWYDTVSKIKPVSEEEETIKRATTRIKMCSKKACLWWRRDDKECYDMKCSKNAGLWWRRDDKVWYDTEYWIKPVSEEGETIKRDTTGYTVIKPVSEEGETNKFVSNSRSALREI